MCGSGSRTIPSGPRPRCSPRSATTTSLGAAVDTGWWATQGYDPVDAIHELSDRLFHVHLKDVEEPGTHVSCMHGEGCARIADCVDALLELGYAGAVSIEHEPFDRDPTAECARMLTLITRAALERTGRARCLSTRSASPSSAAGTSRARTARR